MVSDMIVPLSVSDLRDVDIEQLFGRWYWYGSAKAVRRQLEKSRLYGLYEESLEGIVGLEEYGADLKITSWTPALREGVRDGSLVAGRLLTRAQMHAQELSKRLVAYTADRSGTYGELQYGWLKEKGFDPASLRLSMAATCRVVPADRDDLSVQWKPVAKPQDLASLVTRCYKVSLDPLAKRMSVEQWERTLTAFSRGIKGIYLPELTEVAEYEQVVVGYYVSTAMDGRAYLATLGVDPVWRCRGLGSVVMERFMAQAVRHGFSIASLIVDMDNTPAVRLYEKFGFRQECVEVSGQWEPG